MTEDKPTLKLYEPPAEPQPDIDAARRNFLQMLRDEKPRVAEGTRRGNSR